MKLQNRAQLEEQSKPTNSNSIQAFNGRSSEPNVPRLWQPRLRRRIRRLLLLPPLRLPSRRHCRHRRGRRRLCRSRRRRRGLRRYLLGQPPPPNPRRSESRTDLSVPTPIPILGISQCPRKRCEERGGSGRIWGGSDQPERFWVGFEVCELR